MRWLRALWLVGFMLGTGCFHVDCQAEDLCPGHAVYPDDWNLSECDCPLIQQLRDGTACAREGLTCADDPYVPRISCTCVHTPEGERIWQCGTRDMSVPTIPPRDLATVDDDAGLGDGSVSD